MFKQEFLYSWAEWGIHPLDGELPRDSSLHVSPPNDLQLLNYFVNLEGLQIFRMINQKRINFAVCTSVSTENKRQSILHRLMTGQHFGGDERPSVHLNRASLDNLKTFCETALRPEEFGKLF